MSDYQHYQFSVRFLTSRKQHLAQFPFTVAVAATSDTEARKVAWECIRDEQKRLRNYYDGVNTCEFRTENV